MNRELDHAARALAGTRGFSAEERRAVIDLLRAVSRRDGGADEHRAGLLSRLADRDFVWPEFDQWQAFFAERGAFPPLWEHVRAAPSRQASAEACAAYRVGKLALLLDWLHGLESSRNALAGYARRGIRAAVAKQDEGSHCPVCAPFHNREATDSPGHLPPFHPGCRCLLVAVSTPRPVRRLLPRSA